MIVYLFACLLGWSFLIVVCLFFVCLLACLFVWVVVVLVGGVVVVECVVVVEAVVVVVVVIVGVNLQFLKIQQSRAVVTLGRLHL